MAQSLWPDDLIQQDANVTSPATILREQGTLLGEKTNNLIEVEVKLIEQPGGSYLRPPQEMTEMLSTAIGEARSEQTDRYLYYAFYLVAPLLGNYRYRLFTITHGVIDLYPLAIMMLDEEIQKEISSVEPGKGIRVDSENEFKRLLGHIFAATKTRRIINALLAQSKN